MRALKELFYLLFNIYLLAAAIVWSYTFYTTEDRLDRMSAKTNIATLGVAWVIVNYEYKK